MTTAEIADQIEVWLADNRDEARELKQALERLNGPTPTPTPVPTVQPERQRMRRDWRKRQVLDAIRTTNKAVSSADLAREHGIPLASALRGITDLLAEGKAIRVGTTPRGTPVIRYKPMRIVPGEPVRG